MRTRLLPLLPFLVALPSVCPAQTSSVPYTFKSVAIVGGGFITGFAASPIQRGLYYVRTDIGGAYRWDAKAAQWAPLMDWLPFSERNLMGVESLALDPTDANRLYLAAGTYTGGRSPDGAILRSDDRGRHFETIHAPWKMGGNEPGRFAGPRLAVDPNHPNAMLMGTRLNGLWGSGDRGVTWHRVGGFRSLVLNNDGITFVAYDAGSGAKGSPTPVILAGVANPVMSLIETEDNGRVWKPVAGGPVGMFPNHCVVASDGTLYLSYGNAPGPNGITGGAVWAYTPRTGKWRSVTPEKPGTGLFVAKSGSAKQDGFGYGTVAVDPGNPKTLLVSTIDRWGRGDTIFRSTDAGAHWVSLKPGSTRDSSLAPWTKHTLAEAPFGHWIGAAMIDPFNPRHVLYGTGETIWESHDVGGPAVAGEKSHWAIGAEGIEETADLALLSPDAPGPHLFMGVGDIGCFRNEDISKSPSNGAMKNPELSNCDAIALAADHPQDMVRVGRRWTPGPHGAVSHDGGLHWTPFAAEPKNGQNGGDAAISSDGKLLLWAVRGSELALSADGGGHWRPLPQKPVGREPLQVLADPGKPEGFWAYDPNDGELRALSGSDGAGRPVTKSAPKHGHLRVSGTVLSGNVLWLAKEDGLWRSANAGAAWSRVKTVAAAYAVGFGKAAPGAKAPAIYLAGAIAGTPEADKPAKSKGSIKAGGIYRSLDDGASWQRIDDAAHRYAWIEQIAGDPRVFGRVYLGTNGRGVFRGEPSGK